MIATVSYAALFALFFVALGVRVVHLRRRFLVAVGHAGHAALERAIRAHANFAEYVPFALLLIYFVETRTQAGPFVHVLAGVLLAGRIVHAIGVSRIDEDIRLRVAGMMCTFGVIAAAAVWLLWHAVAAAML